MSTRRRAGHVSAGSGTRSRPAPGGLLREQRGSDVDAYSRDDEHADAQPHRYCDGHSVADPHRDADTHGYGDCCADGHAHGDAGVVVARSTSSSPDDACRSIPVSGTIHELSVR
jgi:hypothetical protein